MRATTTSRRAVEAVTPRIDSQARCRCAVPIVWDEVFGWIHTRRPAGRCLLPQPA